MTQEEWTSLAIEINSDIASISRAVQTRGEIRDGIVMRDKSPNEEFFIDEGAFGLRPSEPRTYYRYGAKLTVWKTHRAGISSRDIKGADLYYEIEDKKFVLIQYKKPDNRQRVQLDREQLEELKRACPIECPPSNRFGCGSWYLVISEQDREYFPACEALNIFGRHKSRFRKYFINGLTAERFFQDFGLCRIGARTQPLDINQYREWSLQNDYVLVSAIRAENERT